MACTHTNIPNAFKYILAMALPLLLQTVTFNYLKSTFLNCPKTSFLTLILSLKST